MQTKNIYLPILKRQQAVTHYAQMRPYRQGGNLISKQSLQGKIFINNYGHGGAGVTLAPGSAIKAVNLLKQHNINKQKFAVLGCGIIGLFTAFELVKIYPQAQISIYSQRIPVYGTKDNTKLFTSQVAPGFWLAYKYGSDDQKTHEQLNTLSFNQFKRISHLQQYKSIVKQVGIFDISEEPLKYVYRDNLPKQLKPSYKQIKIRINQKTQVQGRYFLSYKIDMQPMLKTMIQEMKNKGVKFYQQKIQRKDISKMKQQIIFNCTGLGSKTLLNDSNMKGVKGHLIEYKNPDPKKYDIIFRASIGDNSVNLYMHESRILVGLTSQNIQNSQVEPNVIKQLHDRYEKVLSSLNLIQVKPKL